MTSATAVLGCASRPCKMAPHCSWASRAQRHSWRRRCSLFWVVRRRLRVRRGAWRCWRRRGSLWMLRRDRLLWSRSGGGGSSRNVLHAHYFDWRDVMGSWRWCDGCLTALLYAFYMPSPPFTHQHPSLTALILPSSPTPLTHSFANPSCPNFLPSSRNTFLNRSHSSPSSLPCP
jgi:hypothetical protein